MGAGLGLGHLLLQVVGVTGMRGLDSVGARRGYAGVGELTCVDRGGGPARGQKEGCRHELGHLHGPGVPGTRPADGGVVKGLAVDEQPALLVFGEHMVFHLRGHVAPEVDEIGGEVGLAVLPVAEQAAPQGLDDRRVADGLVLLGLLRLGLHGNDEGLAGTGGTHVELAQGLGQLLSPVGVGHGEGEGRGRPGSLEGQTAPLVVGAGALVFLGEVLELGDRIGLVLGFGQGQGGVEGGATHEQAEGARPVVQVIEVGQGDNGELQALSRVDGHDAHGVLALGVERAGSLLHPVGKTLG